jgi:multidrug efflux pump subunit AcrB
MRHQEVIKQVTWVAAGSNPTHYYNRIMKQDDNPAYAHAMVQADSAARASALVGRLQKDLDARFPETQVIVNTLAQGPPVDSPVGFRIVGPNLDVLETLGDELRRVMHTVPQITHTRASVTSRAKLYYDADQVEAQLAGLTLEDLSGQLQGNLEGLTGGSVIEDLEELPVRIRYDGEVRGSLAQIASMQFVSPVTSQWIPANSLGEMEVEPERGSITRRDGERVNIVYGFVARGALPIEVTQDIVARLDDEGFVLPPGYRLLQEGDSESQAEAVGQLMTYLPILIMLMVASIVLSFRSALLAAIVGSVALLSGGLGMLSLWLGGYNLGFNPLLGSAGLIGVAINGTIVVLAALRADSDARRGDLDAVVRVTQREARHILSTTGTTIGGFLPLLILTGGDFWPPLAVVMAGGVGFSVTLSLLFTPAVYRLACQRLGHQRSPVHEDALGAMT